MVVHAKRRMLPVMFRLFSRSYTDRPTVYNRLGVIFIDLDVITPVLTAGFLLRFCCVFPLTPDIHLTKTVNGEFRQHS